MRWLILSLLIWPLTTGATIYKWTDSQGVIHFSDERPANRKAQRVTFSDDGVNYTFSNVKPRKSTNRKPNRQAVETFTQERPDAATSEAMLEQGSAARQQSCEDARRRLNKMRLASVAYEADAKGRQRILAGEDKRIAERALAGETAFWCNESL